MPPREVPRIMAPTAMSKAPHVASERVTHETSKRDEQRHRTSRLSVWHMKASKRDEQRRRT
jgi:hypothetical protein